jgi:hypothetical protein
MRLGVGSVLARSFRIWGRNVVTFSLLNAVVYAPVLVYGILAFAAPREDRLYAPAELSRALASYAGLVMVSFIAPLAVIHGVLQQLRGERATLLGCLRVYLARLLPALGVGLVVGFLAFLFTFVGAVFVGLLAAAIAAPIVAILALVPPTLVGCMYWVAVPVAAAERQGVLGSLTRSAELTRGSRLAIFVVVLLSLAIQVSPFVVVQAAAPGGVGPAAGLTVLLFAIALGSYGAVATAVAYHDLRVAKDGVGTEDLVRVFA